MKVIAGILFKKVKDLIIISACNICGGQLAGAIYVMQAVGSAFVNSHLTFLLNQKDCRQQDFLP